MDNLEKLQEENKKLEFEILELENAKLRSKIENNRGQQAMNLGARGHQEFAESFVRHRKNEGFKMAGRTYLETMQALVEGEFKRHKIQS